LTATGRRSGKARTVPPFYLRDSGRLVVCDVNPGFERPNLWVLNLRAVPRARVQVGRDTASVRARPTSDQELNGYRPQLTKVWPAYQDFYKGGQRSVFVPEPDSQP
jgi:F420H(2)-dependent quinone reductase